MENHRIFSTSFASVYPHYINKVERKGHTKAELDEIIFWLTGYNEVAFNNYLKTKPILKLFLIKLHNSIQTLQKLQVLSVAIE